MTATHLIREMSFCKLLRLRVLMGISQPKRSSRMLSTVLSEEHNEETHEETFTHQAKPQYDVLYPGHISTTCFQKSLLALGSGIACMLNPARDGILLSLFQFGNLKGIEDMICALGESTGPAALRYMKTKMLADPVGRQILIDKPILNTETIDVKYLGKLPEETFGKAYWNFLSVNGFSPDARRGVNFIDDPELMYVMLRYRQCHDLVHTLLGMPPNMLGEVAVKWFEAVQTRLPLCITAALFGPLRLGPKHRQKYREIYLPWAIRSGYNSKFLMNVYFEKHWEQDMAEFRRELNVEPAPVPLIKTGKNTKTK